MENTDVTEKISLKLYNCPYCCMDNKEVYHPTVHSIKKVIDYVMGEVTYIIRCEVCGDINRFTKKERFS